MGTAGGSSPPDRHAQTPEDIDQAMGNARLAAMQHTPGQPGSPWTPDVFAGAGVSADATNSASQSGYRFDPGNITKLISRWENVLQGLQDDQKIQEMALAAAQPPSPDQPAVQQARLAQASIQEMIDHNVSMQRSAFAYINALKKANDSYTQHDADVAEALGKVNPSNPPTSGMYQ
ncbi:hypothetical protein OG943_33645 [Amycolatopsis sp. NBC_00345]|uniref:hypothetical protein n=1 Tax=Amycolatopsis sp. NBC_00345 TaxID=2975955 RepID=UPI002E269F7F